MLKYFFYSISKLFHLQVVQALIDDAKTQLVSFPLFTRDDIVQIIDAGILDCKFGTGYHNFFINVS